MPLQSIRSLAILMLAMSIFLGLPLLWSGMMAWAGVHIGWSLHAMQNESSRPVQDAGNRGGGIGKAMITKRAKR